MRGNNDVSRVWYMKEENGKWSSPKVASFSKYPSGGPAFFHDGKKLIFHSFRPRNNNMKNAEDSDFWIVEKNENNWSEPKHLDIPLNKDKSSEVYPVVSKDSSIYIYIGRKELIKSAYVNGVYQEPENIGDLFYTDVVDKNKDQKYFLFFSDKGKERFNFQMYVSFHMADGKWSKPIFLGDELHQGKRNTQSIITLDGKYLFYVRYFSVYWTDAKVIEELKPQKIK